MRNLLEMREPLSTDERNELLADAAEAFQQTVITERIFREVLVKLGYNATEIEDEVRRNAPQP